MFIMNRLHLALRPCCISIHFGRLISDKLVSHFIQAAGNIIFEIIKIFLEAIAPCRLDVSAKGLYKLRLSCTFQLFLQRISSNKL